MMTVPMQWKGEKETIKMEKRPRKDGGKNSRKKTQLKKNKNGGKEGLNPRPVSSKAEALAKGATGDHRQLTVRTSFYRSMSACN